MSEFNESENSPHGGKLLGIKEQFKKEIKEIFT